MSRAEFDKHVTRFKERIVFPHDGPVTAFVAVSRAMEIARENPRPQVVLLEGVGLADPLTEAFFAILAELVDGLPSHIPLQDAIVAPGSGA